MLASGFAFSQHTRDGVLSDSEAAFFADKVSDFWFSNNDSSLFYGRKGIEATKGTALPDDFGYLLFTYANALNIRGEKDSAFQYFEKARGIFQETDNSFLYNRSVEQIGSLYRETGSYDTAIQLLNISLDYFKSVQDDYQIRSVLINLGSAWLDKGRYNKALQAYSEAMEFDTYSDTVSSALSFMGAGLVYYNLGNLFSVLNHSKSDKYFEQALEFLKQSEVLFTAINHEMGVCYAQMNEGSVFESKKDFDRLQHILDHSENCYTIADKRVSLSFKALKAVISEENGDFDSALKLRKEIIVEGESIHFPHSYYDNYLSLAKLLYRTGENSSAFNYANLALDWFVENENYPQALNANRLLSEWHKKNNDYEAAFFHMTEANVCMDSVFCDLTNEIFDEMNIKYQKQILTLELESLKNDKGKLNLTIVIVSLILLVGLLAHISLTLFVNMKRKKALLLNQISEEKNKKMELEKLLIEKQLNEQKLTNSLLEEHSNNKQLELQMKDHELIHQSLKHAELLQITRSVQERLGPFHFKIAKKKEQDDYIKTLTEITSMANREVLADFDSVFASMHRNFNEKIIEIAPDITPSEIQVCALLRMNLSSKEIARLNDISSASVDLMRHKIRQKLNLSQQQNLTSFLIGLD